MAVAKEQIRQIISENNINSVADIPDGHRIGGLALGKQRSDGLEHHAALGGKEVLRADPLQSLPHQPVINEQGSQHRHLGGELVLLPRYHVATSSRATRVGSFSGFSGNSSGRMG